MRSSAATNFELAWSVVTRTKSMIACSFGPSFHEGNGAACVPCAWATAESSVWPRVESKAKPEIATRRLTSDFTFHPLRLQSGHRRALERDVGKINIEVAVADVAGENEQDVWLLRLRCDRLRCRRRQNERCENEFVHCWLSNSTYR